MSTAKTLIRTAAAVCLTVLLSGCVIAPAWGPGPYHHPHHDYYGY